MNTTLNQTGRPPKTERPSIYTTKIYKLMQDNLPLAFISDDGRVNTLLLAEAMPNKRMTIYRWFGGGNMSVKAVSRLAEISASAKCERKGRITVEKLLPFCGL